MPLTTESTTFTLDVVGRYTANTFQEARDSADTSQNASARPFDIIIIGGGSFGGVLAQHLLFRDKAKAHRILVLEGGKLALPEHIQNLPLPGIGVPSPTSIAELRAAGQDGKPRQEVWGLAWHSATRFPGLAYSIGGRSVFFGGWSPQLLDDEMPLSLWPAEVKMDLKAQYFHEAATQIGTNETNDFIFGDLHEALRQQLFDGINAGKIGDAIPLENLPLTLDGVEAGRDNLFKLEAPLAVQSAAPRSGYYPANKFSSVPLLIKAARAAQNEAQGDDTKKRLMLVTNCHVNRLVTSNGRVTEVKTNLGSLPVPENGIVVLATATLESARLALLSFEGLPNYDRLGQNLMAHLRSNLTIRIPRDGLAALDPNVKELQSSALFVKGKHVHTDNAPGFFHLQITAAGLATPGADSEAELFKKVPDIDGFEAFRNVTDKHVVITLRGIGEMEPRNPGSFVRLDPEPDEFGVQRAFVAIAPTDRDRALWEAMDKASDDAARVLAGGKDYEVLTANGFKPVKANQSVAEVHPFAARRDGMGTTHHEAGTLAMGADPTMSVTNAHGQVHHVANAYVMGPALFPTVGSPNPMLTGVALARRMGDYLTGKRPPTLPEEGFTALFDGLSTANWRMAGRGNFIAVGEVLEAVPGDDLGLFWCTTPTPPDFTLRLQWMRTRDDDNAGVFIRFPHPDSKGYNNTAWVGVHYGFEVQIDEAGRPDGAGIHRTGALYGEPTQLLSPQAALPVGQWNDYEIRVKGQTYTVFLNGAQVTQFQNPHANRGLPGTPDAPSFLGLQAHTGRVLFRNIRIMEGLPIGPEAVVAVSEPVKAATRKKVKV